VAPWELAFPHARESQGRADRFKRRGGLVDNYNATCQPFTWAATADSILEKLSRLFGRIDGTGH